MSLYPSPAPVPAVSLDTSSMLRAVSAQAHASIEAVVALEGEFDLPHYRRVLRGFDAFLHAWEPLVAGALPAHLAGWFETRRRADAVRRDLLALDAGVPPRARLHLLLHSTAAAMGSLYVLEGSALGAQVIAPRVQRRLGIGADNGGSYFAGWGRETGARWREFRDLLDEVVGADQRSRAQAAAAAVATFDSLRSVLRDELDLEPAAQR